MTWQCFMAERTNRGAQYLRRFTWKSAGACPAHGDWSHDVSVQLEEVPLTGAVYEGAVHDHIPHGDPRWPIACACGYIFQDSDQWQHGSERIYVRPGTDESFTLRKAPAGAMWYSRWIPYEELPADINVGILSPHYWRDHFGKRPPLSVKLPGRFDWCVDQRANNGDGWHVTGEPPLITAQPSILVPDYHGWLQAGVLTDDTDGRSYT